MDVTRWVRQQWDRVGAWACIGLGGLVLLFGWLGMSKTAYSAEQLPYILSGGIFGLFLLGLGAMLWLSADLRDEWRKLDRIEAALNRGQAVQSGSKVVTQAAERDSQAENRVTAISGRGRA